MTWNTKCDYVLGIEGVLDLPETRFHGLLEQAGADLSNTNEQCNLGFFYDRAKRYDKALEWYMKGARQGEKCCEYNIGMYYRYGHGVERNIDTALEWFTKSAEKGFATAQNQAGASTTARDDTKRRSSGSRNRPLKATLYANTTSGSATRKAKA